MNMDELSLLSQGVDYSEIPAIHQKRTLAFINHFICNTVSLMNKLSRSCETKLEKFETQLQRMDACLCILETKLASVPGLEGEVLEVRTEATASIPATVPATIPSVPVNAPAPPANVVAAAPVQQPQPTEAPQQDATAQGASQDPRYARFFRMVHMGVPPQAVKIKMQSEGVDPSVLDNPNAVPPPPMPRATSESESSSSVSDSE